MDQDFLTFHLPGLTTDEIKYGLLLDLMVSKIANDYYVETWTLETPGACAVRQSCYDRQWAIVLGDVNQEQARHLADLTLDYTGARPTYPGVIGAGLTAHWFACRAAEHGVKFGDIEPQQIYATDGSALTMPKVSGQERPVMGEDAEIFEDWLIKFAHESSPLDPIPTSADAVRLAHSGDYMFWIADGEIVSMAGITRRLAKTAAVTAVYTPPELRGRGYAAAITAVVAERIHVSGRIATLYTDLRVPAANRCYSRIGFRAAHPSLHFHVAN